MTPTTEVMTFLNEDYSLRREYTCIQEAKRAKMEIVRGDDHTLVFDLDSEEAYQTFRERVHFLEAKFGMIHLEVTKSKSGNYHALATLDPTFPPVDPLLSFAIQACMGSDWKKEMLGVLRTVNYQHSDSLLFRPQELEVVFEWNRPTD